MNNDKAITVNSSPSMNIPKVEIRCFDGSPSDYMSFITVFDESVGKANIDGQAKLTRLLQYTTGSARSAIDCCALIGGSKGYDEARTILEERFGDPYVITTTLLEKLTVNKEVRSPAALRSLADELNSARIILQAKSMYTELNNQHHIKAIGSRLSTFLWSKWKDRVFQIKREHGRYATFDEFVDFIKLKAQEACDPVYGHGVAVGNISTTVRASSSSRSTTLNNVAASDSSNDMCVVCKNKHPIFMCPEFKLLDVIKRLEIVRKHSFCFNCLNPGHMASLCKKRSFCRVPDCSIKHNNLLHQTHVSNNTVGSDMSNNLRVCLPIVRILVNGTHEVYVLLDTGSTSTLVTNDLVSKLSLPTSYKSKFENIE